MMHKNEFLKALKCALSALDRTERDRYLAYYNELIDDKIEAGMAEAEAVGGFGDVSVLADQITKDAAERGLLRHKRSPLMIALLILGSPLWLSLLIACFAVVISLSAAIVALIIAFFAVELALVVAGVAAIVEIFIFIAHDIRFAMLLLGAGLICTSLAVILFYPLVCMSKASVKYIKKICIYVRKKLKIGGEII